MTQMAIAGRKARLGQLKDLFGNTSHLDFTIYACHWRRPNSVEEFEIICRNYDLDPNHDITYEVPPTCSTDEIFNPAVIIKAGEFRQASVKEIEPIFTQTACVRLDKSNDKDVQEILEVRTNDIVSCYAAEMERQKTGYRFGDELSAMADNAEIAFRYSLHKFDPEVCHPSLVGALRPMTIIPGVVIEPQKPQSLKLPQSIQKRSR